MTATIRNARATTTAELVAKSFVWNELGGNRTPNPQIKSPLTRSGNANVLSDSAREDGE